MKLLSKLLLLILLPTFLLFSCSDPNCLACENQICTSCAIFDFYYLENNECQKYAGFHCQAINLAGNCLKCEDGFTLMENNTCVYVFNKIANCKSYQVVQGEIICSICEEGFHETRDQCYPDIANCLNYQFGRNRCYVCESGFEPSSDLLSCVSVLSSKSE